MNGLDLFSGIGGIGIALSPWVRTVAYCEQDRYAQAILLSRMQSGELDRAPIWDDVRTLRAEHFGIPIDVIFGGFPCQDISTAGRGAGLEGKRSALFFEICRLIGELRPSFVFLENVPAIAVRGLDRVLLELTALGYDTRWTTLSAASIGACHKRRRWFLLAYSNGESLRIEQEQELNEQKIWIESACFKGINSNTAESGLERPHGQKGFGKKELAKPAGYNRWTTEPAIRGRDHGIQNRLDRLKCLGNAVVPIQARKAFSKLIGLNEIA